MLVCSQLLYFFLLITILILYTGIIWDTIQRKCITYFTTRIRLNIDWHDTCVIGIIAIFILGDALYRNQPQDPLSYEMLIVLCTQIFYIYVGIHLYKRIRKLTETARHQNCGSLTYTYFVSDTK